MKTDEATILKQRIQDAYTIIRLEKLNIESCQEKLLLLEKQDDKKEGCEFTFNPEPVNYPFKNEKLKATKQ